MLTIVVPATENYDEQKEEFVYTKERELQLEHSLVSISKWESKFKKPFLSKDKKTYEETKEYIKCMTLTKNVSDETFDVMSQSRPIVSQIMAYIDDPMTATTFGKLPNQKQNREVITSELIYYWMIALNIPKEFEKWHLNRLMTLIKVCNIKNTPPKKMSKHGALSQQAALNAARRGHV